jgi:hypothetical protein
MVAPDPSKVRRQAKTDAVEPELSDAMKARMSTGNLMRFQDWREAVYKWLAPRHRTDPSVRGACGFVLAGTLSRTLSTSDSATMSTSTRSGAWE